MRRKEEDGGRRRKKNEEGRRGRRGRRRKNTEEEGGRGEKRGVSQSLDVIRTAVVLFHFLFNISVSIKDKYTKFWI